MHAPITRHYLKLIDTAEAIRLDPDKVEAAFMARQLVWCIRELTPRMWTCNGSCPNGIKLSPNIRCINMLRVSQHEVRSSVRAMQAA
jgi:hypothetical protein